MRKVDITTDMRAPAVLELVKKYWYAYSVSLQETLQRRSTLILDRVGGFAILLSLYSFWTALLGDKPSFMGYTRSEMLAYVLVINVLRSLVFTGRGWQLVQEISNGKISSYLVRPISYHLYSLSLDLAQKTVHVFSAFVEVGILAYFIGGSLFLPRHASTWLLFAVSAVLASLIFFFMEFLVSSLAFWTSESGGPLFCFELFLQFAAGAFFPLDVLPEALRRLLSATPFPTWCTFPYAYSLRKSPRRDRARAVRRGRLAGRVRRRGVGRLARRRELLRRGGRLMETARKYARIWLRTASMALQAQLTYRLGSMGFLIGKMIRLLFFFAFVVAIFNHVDTVAGYNLVETALFFLTFNVVDMTSQILFRGVYGARRIVSEGDFDFYLVQPCSPLFRMVCSTVDFLDIVTLIPVLVMVGMVFARLPPLGWGRYAAYAVLVVNGVALVFSIHVLVGALTVRTQELENAIWIYRDVMFMGKFPVDVYAPAVRWVLTFGVPIAVMTSFPSKALLGILSPAWAAYGVGLTAVFLALAGWFWRDSVARYTSSSS